MSKSHIQANYPEPHIGRTRQILAAHPEISQLFGNTPSTSFYVVAIVALQVAVAYAMHDQPWWVMLIAAYTVGALANHALWTLIHDATHNLIFKSSWANSLIAILANLPFVFPSAISFRIYHIKHHIYQGDLDRDADLARPFEARLVGNSTVLKALWMLLFPLSQLVRVPFLKGIEFFNRWVVLNFVVQIGFLAAMYFVAGWDALIYLTMASFFSVGLHPVGGRWIQEHYVVHEQQETYSYYGPLNKVAFNVGFHNEHHDLMRVPWSRLPRVREMAPEFYNSLYWHPSWTKLLLRFIFDKKMSLYSRVVRSSKSLSAAGKAAAAPKKDAMPLDPKPAMT